MDCISDTTCTKLTMEQCIAITYLPSLDTIVYTDTDKIRNFNFNIGVPSVMPEWLMNKILHAYKRIQRYFKSNGLVIKILNRKRRLILVTRDSSI